MKNNTKIWTTLGSVAALATPIVAVISCTDESAKNTKPTETTPKLTPEQKTEALVHTAIANTFKKLPAFTHLLDQNMDNQTTFVEYAKNYVELAKTGENSQGAQLVNFMFGTIKSLIKHLEVEIPKAAPAITLKDVDTIIDVLTHGTMSEFSHSFKGEGTKEQKGFFGLVGNLILDIVTGKQPIDIQNIAALISSEHVQSMLKVNTSIPKVMMMIGDITHNKDKLIAGLQIAFTKAWKEDIHASIANGDATDGIMTRNSEWFKELTNAIPFQELIDLIWPKIKGQVEPLIAMAKEKGLPMIQGFFTATKAIWSDALLHDDAQKFINGMVAWMIQGADASVIPAGFNTFDVKALKTPQQFKEAATKIQQLMWGKFGVNMMLAIPLGKIAEKLPFLKPTLLQLVQHTIPNTVIAGIEKMLHAEHFTTVAEKLLSVLPTFAIEKIQEWLFADGVDSHKNIYNLVHQLFDGNTADADTTTVANMFKTIFDNATTN